MVDKFLNENYDMNSKITLKDILRVYYNGKGCFDIYGLDKTTYETFIGAFEYEDIIGTKYEDLQVIYFNKDNIIVFIKDIDNFKELYLD